MHRTQVNFNPQPISQRNRKWHRSLDWHRTTNDSHCLSQNPFLTTPCDRFSPLSTSAWALSFFFINLRLWELCFIKYCFQVYSKGRGKRKQMFTTSCFKSPAASWLQQWVHALDLLAIWNGTESPLAGPRVTPTKHLLITLSYTPTVES